MQLFLFGPRKKNKKITQPNPERTDKTNHKTQKRQSQTAVSLAPMLIVSLNSFKIADSSSFLTHCHFLIFDSTKTKSTVAVVIAAVLAS